MQGPSCSAADLAARLGQCCPPARIDLAGAVALPCRLPHARAWFDWLDRGRSAGLEYLARDPAGRTDPTLANPWARSLLVFAQRYSDGWPADDRSPLDGVARRNHWTAGVSRYARGLDYHRVFLRDVRSALSALAAVYPRWRATASVDTGPFLEREWAWLAGLGFFGKNSCLIHERLGSGLFLAVALTNLRIDGLPAPGRPAPGPLFGVVGRPPEVDGTPAPPDRAGPDSRCGNCCECLKACPTGALVEPFKLDANLCLSTWTIEWRGRAPADLRERQGGRLFGCDICQAVCPWNRKAAASAYPPPPRPEYGTLAEHRELELLDLLDLNETDFHQRFKPTPLWRAHCHGLRRNALTVAALTGRDELVERISHLARRENDPKIQEIARWAERRLRERSW